MKVKAIILIPKLSFDNPGDICYLELPYKDGGYIRYGDDRWLLPGMKNHFSCKPCDFKILSVKTYYELL